MTIMRKKMFFRRGRSLFDFNHCDFRDFSIEKYMNEKTNSTSS